MWFVVIIRAYLWVVRDHHIFILASRSMCWSRSWVLRLVVVIIVNSHCLMMVWYQRIWGLNLMMVQIIVVVHLVLIFHVDSSKLMMMVLVMVNVLRHDNFIAIDLIINELRLIVIHLVMIIHTRVNHQLRIWIRVNIVRNVRRNWVLIILVSLFFFVCFFAAKAGDIVKIE